jgi:hypothetical protein
VNGAQAGLQLLGNQANPFLQGSRLAHRRPQSQERLFKALFGLPFPGIFQLLQRGCQLPQQNPQERLFLLVGGSAPQLGSQHQDPQAAPPPYRREGVDEAALDPAQPLGFSLPKAHARLLGKVGHADGPLLEHHLLEDLPRL